MNGDVLLLPRCSPQTCGALGLHSSFLVAPSALLSFQSSLLNFSTGKYFMTLCLPGQTKIQEYVSLNYVLSLKKEVQPNKRNINKHKETHLQVWFPWNPLVLLWNFHGSASLWFLLHARLFQVPVPSTHILHYPQNNFTPSFFSVSLAGIEKEAAEKLGGETTIF